MKQVRSRIIICFVAVDVAFSGPLLIAAFVFAVAAVVTASLFVLAVVAVVTAAVAAVVAVAGSCLC